MCRKRRNMKNPLEPKRKKKWTMAEFFLWRRKSPSEHSTHHCQMQKNVNAEDWQQVANQHSRTDANKQLPDEDELTPE